MFCLLLLSCTLAQGIDYSKPKVDAQIFFFSPQIANLLFLGLLPLSLSEPLVIIYNIIKRGIAKLRWTGGRSGPFNC
jgi:hypothetical protein